MIENVIEISPLVNELKLIAGQTPGSESEHFLPPAVTEMVMWLAKSKLNKNQASWPTIEVIGYNNSNFFNKLLTDQLISVGELIIRSMSD